jgi:hypothetical protein
MWNQEQMSEKIIKLFENSKTEVLAFLSAYTLTITTDNDKFQIPKKNARNRGIKLRYITEITNDNLSYCKRQLDLVDELRHLDKIKGNFVLSNSEFIASHEISRQHPITDGFYSNVKKIVKLQGYIFETLWDNATPAVERIKQLETAAGNVSAKPNHALKKEQRTIDRFYVCEQCQSIFIYAD